MLDRIKGCLIGGAAGDALGFSVEFLQDFSIFKRYGEMGITEFNYCKTPIGEKAIVSDDTQMTLFTADGLLQAFKEKERPDIDDCIKCVHESYLSWLSTQEDDFVLPNNVRNSELLNYRILHARRAPGNTCLSALYSGRCGSIERPINNSKGCGGIMRVAPVGLLLGKMKQVRMSSIGILGAEVAAITHGHELGYTPSAMLAMMIAHILRGETLYGSIIKSKNELLGIFSETGDMKWLIELVDKAVELAQSPNSDDLEDIRELGEGWVAEETLAIAIYCALKYENDFEKALIASVNHSGDSDSTGAVTGNILGSYLGLSKIPDKFKQKIDVLDIIDSISRQLADID